MTSDLLGYENPYPVAFLNAPSSNMVDVAIRCYTIWGEIVIDILFSTISPFSENATCMSIHLSLPAASAHSVFAENVLLSISPYLNWQKLPVGFHIRIFISELNGFTVVDSDNPPAEWLHGSRRMRWIFHSPELWKGLSVVGNSYAQRYSKTEARFGFLAYLMNILYSLSKESKWIHTGTRSASFQGEQSGEGKQTRIFQIVACILVGKAARWSEIGVYRFAGFLQAGSFQTSCTSFTPVLMSDPHEWLCGDDPHIDDGEGDCWGISCIFC